MTKKTINPNEKKHCPVCGHPFQGRGWTGIDAHWRANHEKIMSYEKAWPLIRAGKNPAND